MSLYDHIVRVFRVLRPEKNWDTIYWMIDVHGTIIPNNWHKEADFAFIRMECREVLRWISKRKDQRLILWTSSYKDEVSKLIGWLGTEGVHVDYVDENPEEDNTTYADFSRKPYFNILIDDKAGFNPNFEWSDIRIALMNVGEWDKKE